MGSRRSAARSSRRRGGVAVVIQPAVRPRPPSDDIAQHPCADPLLPAGLSICPNCSLRYLVAFLNDETPDASAQEIALLWQQQCSRRAPSPRVQQPKRAFTRRKESRAPSPAFNTLELWRDAGAFCIKQEPAPVGTKGATSACKPGSDTSEITAELTFCLKEEPDPSLCTTSSLGSPRCDPTPSPTAPSEASGSHFKDSSSVGHGVVQLAACGPSVLGDFDVLANFVA